jgi:hypothetical protein
VAATYPCVYVVWLDPHWMWWLLTWGNWMLGSFVWILFRVWASYIVWTLHLFCQVIPLWLFIYVWLDVLIWNYVYIQFPVVVVMLLFCCSGTIWNTNTEKTHTQTPMPLVGFEPTIAAFERAKTVHTSDSAATVIGMICSLEVLFSWESLILYYWIHESRALRQQQKNWIFKF